MGVDLLHDNTSVPHLLGTKTIENSVQATEQVQTKTLIIYSRHRHNGKFCRNFLAKQMFGKKINLGLILNFFFQGRQ